MKTQRIALIALAVALATGVAQAETLRAITTDAHGSYALDTDSIVKSNGKTAFTVQTIYSNKMTAPNNARGFISCIVLIGIAAVVYFFSVACSLQCVIG